MYYPSAGAFTHTPVEAARRRPRPAHTRPPPLSFS